jgi:hypothetical protein
MYMITPEQFYQGFQADYFAYRQLRLKNELDSLLKDPTAATLDSIYDYSFDDHLRSIKIDIRQTYFQSIETVFELLFSFKPSGSLIRDDLVLQNLIKRKDHYEDIRKFAEGKGGLEFLEQTFDYGELGSVLGIQYLFYGLLKDDKLSGQLTESLQAIRIILKIIARDISDRKEYNSYKHGLRIFPMSNFFSIHDHKTKEEILKWDIKDSMSFMEKDEKTGQIDVVTKLFDPERDRNLTIMCNNLISNIIMIRRGAFQKEGKKTAIMPFNTVDVERLSKPNVAIQDLKISTIPVKNGE